MELPDMELVAAAVHDAWMEQKRAKGILSAPSQATGEEQMRPYAELSNEVQEYDRATVRAVYAAIREAAAPSAPPAPDAAGRAGIASTENRADTVTCVQCGTVVPSHSAWSASGPRCLQHEGSPPAPRCVKCQLPEDQHGDFGFRDHAYVAPDEEP